MESRKFKYELGSRVLIEGKIFEIVGRVNHYSCPIYLVPDKNGWTLADHSDPQLHKGGSINEWTDQEFLYDKLISGERYYWIREDKLTQLPIEVQILDKIRREVWQ